MTESQPTPVVVRAEKNVFVLAVLWLFFGVFGANWLYINRASRGIVMPLVYMVLLFGSCSLAGRAAPGDQEGLFGTLFVGYVLMFFVWLYDGFASYKFLAEHNRGV